MERSECKHELCGVVAYDRLGQGEAGLRLVLDRLVKQPREGSSLQELHHEMEMLGGAKAAARVREPRVRRLRKLREHTTLRHELDRHLVGRERVQTHSLHCVRAPVAAPAHKRHAPERPLAQHAQDRKVRRGAARAPPIDDARVGLRRNHCAAVPKTLAARLRSKPKLLRLLAQPLRRRLCSRLRRLCSRRLRRRRRRRLRRRRRSRCLCLRRRPLFLSFLELKLLDRP